MTISDEVFENHAEKWSKILAKGYYQYRRNWPRRLFRHEPVENAALIINSGQLLSRVQARGKIARDIADAQVLATQKAAHSKARLYFRPLNPTQYHVEGIRRAGDFFNGDPTNHAPVLVIFVFESKYILQTEGVMFSDGNMQRNETEVYSDEAEFISLPFDQIYHTGPYSSGEDIKRRRCAEVLLPSPLALDDRLQAVMCRSPAERSFLLHLLTPERRETWANRVRVYSEPGLFEDRFLYVKTVTLSSGELGATVKLRHDGARFKIRMKVSGSGVDHDGEGSGTGGAWRLALNPRLGPGDYLVELWLDDCLAYQALSHLDEAPF